MTLITFPSSPKAQTMAWKLVQPTQVNISEWTGARQVLSSGRGWWECSMVLPPMVGEAAISPWRAFLALSAGSTNTFNVPVTGNAQSSSSATPAVNGGSQTGYSLTTDGWPTSTTVLTAGQYVTINGQLLQLTTDITSNSGGAATITFSPAIRTSPADNAAIEFKNPYAVMYLTDTPTVSGGPGLVYELSLELRESF